MNNEKSRAQSAALRLTSWQEALWLLLALLTPLFVNLWVEQQFEASKVWLLRTLIWLLAVLWLAAWLYGMRPRTLPVPVSTLLPLLALVVALATLLSPHRYIALFGTIDRANGALTQLSYLLLFFSVAGLVSRHSGRQLLQLLILTSLPIGLLGLAQAAGWQPLNLLTDARTQLTTTLGRSNFTGAYLAMLLPLTWTAALAAQRRAPRAAYALLTALQLVVIALTLARAAWIAAAAALGALLWLRVAPAWSRRRRWLIAAAGLTLLALALPALVTRGLAGGGSTAARWTIWQTSLRLLWPRLWLGYGADTLELQFPAVYPPQLVYYQGRGVVVDRAHNWLLDYSLSYGVVATLLLVMLIAAVMLGGWRRLKTPNRGDRPLLANDWLAACIAALCAQLVGNLFLFEVAATSILFWTLLALVTAAIVTDQPRTAQPLLSPPLRLGVLTLSILLLGWAVWQSNLRPLLADHRSWRGSWALSRGDVDAALDEYSAAALLQPRRATYHVARALTAAQLGSYEQAEQALRQAIALHPADPVLYTQLAAIYARQADETAAKRAAAYAAYEQAVALAPTIALTHQQYADLALRSGDVQLALAQAQRAVDLDATDALSHAVVGWAQLHSGRPAAAQSAFEQGLRWRPQSADLHVGLATAHFQQGNRDAARAEAALALQLDPANGPALTLQLQLADR